MPPAPYPDFRWIVGPLRILPVIAVAALVGGAIGGFSVFAIDFATAPTSHDTQIKQTKIGGPPRGSENTPTPNVDLSEHTPAAGTSAPPPVQANAAPQHQTTATGEPGAPASAQAPQVAVTPPPPEPQKVWPDALSRRHEEAQSKAAPAEPTSATTAPASDKPVVHEQAAPERSATTTAPARLKPTVHEESPPERSAATAGVAAKPAPAKPRVVSKRRARPMENAAAEGSRERRPVYDYYGRDDQRVTSDTDADEPRNGYVRQELGQNRVGSNAAPPVDESEDRPVIHRVERPDMDDDDDALPPQPAPPPLFFGLFGNL